MQRPPPTPQPKPKPRPQQVSLDRPKKLPYRVLFVPCAAILAVCWVSWELTPCVRERKAKERKSIQNLFKLIE